MSDSIPKQVKEKAKVLIDLYGDAFDYIGKYQGMDVYQYLFPKNTVTGYPILFLVSSTGDVEEKTGPGVFEIIKVVIGL